MITTIYVDLDGVLADFDTGYERAFGVRPSRDADNVDWGLVKTKTDFYRDLPPMGDYLHTWARVFRYGPIILTGVPRSLPVAAHNKRAWVDLHLGQGVPMIACASRDKAQHCKPGDVLIDDWEKYRHLWEAAGGRWVTHTNAFDTDRQLTELGL